MKKGLDERIDEGILRWFSQKRWIDTMKYCLKKRGLDIRKARRLVQHKIEWQGFVRANAWGIAQGMNH